MRYNLRTWMVTGTPLAGHALMLGVRTASAAGFGIAQLDGFMTTFSAGVTGLGLAVGSVGLVGWIMSTMENPFSTLLSGSINFFTKANQNWPLAA